MNVPRKVLGVLATCALAVIAGAVGEAGGWWGAVRLVGEATKAEVCRLS